MSRAAKSYACAPIDHRCSGPVAPILKDVFSSADVIIYYGADGNLSPFDITGIGQESNRVVDAMAEFSEARAVPDRCSEFKTYGIEEAAEFIGCEKFGKEHGIEDAYDEFSEKQLNQLKIDDDMRAARGYKETVKLAIDGVAGGSITDYGRRNAENYGQGGSATIGRAISKGISPASMKRWRRRPSAATSHISETGGPIARRRPRRRVGSGGKPSGGAKSQRQSSGNTPRRGGPTSSRRLSKKAAPTRFSASSASMALTPTTDSCACPFVPHTAERSAPRSRRLPGARSRCHPASWRPRRIPCLYPWGR